MASEAPLPIVGLGASAGGLEALEALFRAAPDEAGVAYVIVTHLAPGRASMMVEILSRSTRMKVGEAHDGEPLEADCVYVIAPDTVLTVVDGELRVQALPPPRRERHPIDTLFGSIAEARGERGVGVVLSGAGADGSLGVKAIKERGGLTLAQAADGSAPRHHAMPSAAIATGLVDLVVPVEEMPERIIAYVRSLDAPDERRAPPPASTEAERQEKAEQAIHRPRCAGGSATISAATMKAPSCAGSAGACGCCSSRRWRPTPSACACTRTRRACCSATC